MRKLDTNRLKSFMGIMTSLLIMLIGGAGLFWISLQPAKTIIIAILILISILFIYFLYLLFDWLFPRVDNKDTKGKTE